MSKFTGLVQAAKDLATKIGLPEPTDDEVLDALLTAVARAGKESTAGIALVGDDGASPHVIALVVVPTGTPIASFQIFCQEFERTALARTQVPRPVEVAAEPHAAEQLKPLPENQVV